MTTHSPSDPSAVAAADLAARLGVGIDEVSVVSMEEVTWRDGSIGCPQPGRMYTQALVPGSLIVLRAKGQTYEYHAGGGRAPFLCQDPKPPLSTR